MPLSRLSLKAMLRIMFIRGLVHAGMCSISNNRG
nr:MAG TPA_asm: hypothetical protein [Caudoviricetes sp.]